MDLVTSLFAVLGPWHQWYARGRILYDRENLSCKCFHLVNFCLCFCSVILSVFFLFPTLVPEYASDGLRYLWSITHYLIEFLFWQVFIHYIVEQVNLGSLARDGSPLTVTENVTSATTTHVTKVSEKKSSGRQFFANAFLEGWQCTYIYRYIYVCVFLFCRRWREATRRQELKKGLSLLVMMMLIKIR